MVRTAFVMALVLVAACGKDVEDPGFTASASATMDPPATTSSGGEASSSGGPSTNASNSNTGDSADSSSSGGDSTSTSGPVDPTSSSGCGDGVISTGEQCDGADLQGFTCNSLGLNGGTLACDPIMCTFDTSMCMSTSGGTSG